MSIESLLADEPLAMLCRKAHPGETDEAGVPLDDDAILNVGPIVGRLTVLSARGVDMWKASGVDADYEFTTCDTSRPRRGMFIRSFDNRLFVIGADSSIEYPKNGIYPATNVLPLSSKTTGSGGASGVGGGPEL